MGADSVSDASMGDAGYLLDNRQSQAGVRFGALASLLDPVTTRHLDGLGIGPGWRCWEVGAGGPSVPGWLADRVGPTGSVLATDIDTSWLPADADGTGTADGTGGRYEVRRHDVGVDDPPGSGFDLVHARLVLVHVPGRDRALRSMVDALRPGGWLLLEDADPALQPMICPDEYGPEQALANKLRLGFRELLGGRAADLAYGRTLPRLLREVGLRDVRADGYFPLTGPECTVLELATIDQIRERLVSGGIATDAEVDRHRDNLVAGRVPDLATAPMISAWGRKPG